MRDVGIEPIYTTLIRSSSIPTTYLALIIYNTYMRVTLYIILMFK